MKMKSAIREMYYGNRGQQDSIKMTKKYHKIMEETVKNEKILREKLTVYPELLSYDAIDNSIGTASSEETAFSYVEGFKFGLLMGLEVGNNEE